VQGDSNIVRRNFVATFIFEISTIVPWRKNHQKIRANIRIISSRRYSIGKDKLPVRVGTLGGNLSGPKAYSLAERRAAIRIPNRLTRISQERFHLRVVPDDEAWSIILGAERTSGIFDETPLRSGFASKARFARFPRGFNPHVRTVMERWVSQTVPVVACVEYGIDSCGATSKVTECDVGQF